MKVVYLAHDLNDPAIARRTRMLSDAGADVTLIGFTRGNQEVAPVASVVPVLLGRTENGRLARRAGSVASAMMRLPQWAHHLAGADVVVARTLEMLLLAAMGRRMAAPKAKLVYECLDIHRMMLGSGRGGAAMRGLERRLLRHTDGLIVSSPAFITQHFQRYGILPPVHLVENRVLDSEAATPLPRPIPGPPWKIGWFGIIRCRKSLDLLSQLVRRCPGQVEVIIRGRPARDVLPDFDAVVANTPGLVFEGAYDRSTDLARIYGEVHFTWAIDYYEAGANSDWLLPNRLYEGSLYGAVPIALQGVETGRWLARHGCGVLMTTPDELEIRMRSMDPDSYARAQHAIESIPRADLVEEAGFGAGLLSSITA